MRISSWMKAPRVRRFWTGNSFECSVSRRQSKEKLPMWDTPRKLPERSSSKRSPRARFL